ncbi:MAG: hypothetical protein CVV58_04865, partial [Tenericutes bacterium HGW-Tenericutes-3]
MSKDYRPIIEFQLKIYSILKSITLMAFIPLLWFGSIFYFITDAALYGFIEIGAGLFLLYCVYTKKISIRNKKKIIIYVVYLFSVFLLLTTGKAGGGFIG